MQRRAILAAALITATAGVASPMLTATAAAWAPDEIPWERRAANGTRYALLEGDRATPGGTFTYAFAIPAGGWDGPHRHSTTARVFVAKGRLSLGYGDRPDRAKMRDYPAGSVLIVPAGAVHYDGAAVDTVIIGVASGPWSTSYLDGTAPTSAGTPVKRP